MSKSTSYTTHALQRMLLRGISKEMTDEAICKPDQTGMGYKSRLLAYKSFGNKRIKVVYIETVERFIVISAMWD